MTTRQRHVLAHGFWSVGQKIYPTNVWAEADPDFWHTQFCRICCYSVRAGRGNADSPAQHQPVHDCDVRLWVIINPVIKCVFLPEERSRSLQIIIDGIVVDRYDIPTGTQSTIT